LWKTGFSLDEGPVRDYQNPDNKEFLEYIKRGYVGYYIIIAYYMSKKFLIFCSHNREVPMELIRESRGREVHLQMEDHRMEEFISKKSRFQVFF